MDARWSKLLEFVCSPKETESDSVDTDNSSHHPLPQFSKVESTLLKFGTQHRYHRAFTPWAATEGMYRGGHPRSTQPQWKSEPYVISHPLHNHSGLCSIDRDGYVVIEKSIPIPEDAVNAGHPCLETNDEWLSRYAQAKSQLRKREK